MKTSEEEKLLHQTIQKALEDDRLPCAKAFQIARDLKIPIHKVGEACNQLRIKINHCQLGCFP